MASKKKASKKKTSSTRGQSKRQDTAKFAMFAKDPKWSLRYRGELDPRPEGPDTNPNQAIFHLASVAVKEDAFRRELSVLENFRGRFIRELATRPDELCPLSEDEIAFCQGWLYLIHATPNNPNQSKDEQILEAIQRHLRGGGYGPGGVSG